MKQTSPGIAWWIFTSHLCEEKRPHVIIQSMYTSSCSVLICGHCFGRPSYFTIRANKKHFLENNLPMLLSDVLASSQRTHVVHPYRQKIIGQEVYMSRRIYCIAPLLTWFKSSQFVSVVTRNSVVYVIYDITALQYWVKDGLQTFHNAPRSFEFVKQLMTGHS